MYIIKQDELYHYGVKGMKWGVRKDNGSSGGRGGKIVQSYLKITNPWLYAGTKRGVRNFKQGVSFIKAKSESKEARNAANYYKNVTGARSSAAVKKYRHKNIDGMSDADIRKAINRMNLEKDYRNLTKADILRGKRFADSAFDYRAKYKTIRKITTKV